MYLLYNIVYLLHLVESNQFYNLYCEHPLMLDSSEEKLAIIKKNKKKTGGNIGRKLRKSHRGGIPLF